MCAKMMEYIKIKDSTKDVDDNLQRVEKPSKFKEKCTKEYYDYDCDRSTNKCNDRYQDDD